MVDLISIMILDMSIGSLDISLNVVYIIVATTSKYYFSGQ